MREARVTAAPLSVRVHAWPDEGRPFGFGGAIGSFDLKLEVEPRELAVGENLRAVLTITGVGNFGRLDPPDFRPAGFDARGRRIERADDTLVAVYDLAPNEPVHALPAIELVYLDPQLGSYHRVRSAAVPLTVRALQPVATPRSSAASTAPQSEISEPTTAPTWFWGGGAGLVLVLALLVRARSRTPAEPDDERVVAARAVLRAQLTEASNEASVELGLSFAEYLAARLGCTTHDIMTGKLAPRLSAAGASIDLSERCAHLFDSLIGARYGGPEPAEAHTRVGELLRELEAVRWS